MIDWKKTEIKTGYSKEYFDKYPRSNRKVYAICDKCNKDRFIIFQDYRNLCKTCSNKSRIGKKFTDETRQKMKDNHVGMKGKYHSDETKDKIGEWGKGRKHTDESIRLMSDKHIGKKFSDEHKINISCSKQGINREDFTKFIGKHSDRNYIFSKELCIQLNNKIEGFNAHHILPSVIIYIPADLHRSVRHDLKHNKNMKEINELALQYLMGEY